MTHEHSIRISVIVAAYNVEQYISECLSSLLRQTCSDCEFIIVDDGSSDNTGAICEKYSLSDSRFHIIHHKNNNGLLGARKTGIEAAQGEYTLFLDGDDILIDDKALDTILLVLAQSSSDITVFEATAFNGSKESLGIMQRYLRLKCFCKTIKSSRNILNSYFSDHKKLPWHIWSKVYKTIILKRVATYIPLEKITYGEDVFLTFVISHLSNTLTINKKYRFYGYRLGSGISTRTTDINKLASIMTTDIVLHNLEKYVGLQTSNAAIKYLGKNLQWLTDRFMQNIVDCFEKLNESSKPSGLALMLASGLNKGLLLKKLSTAFSNGNLLSLAKACTYSAPLINIGYPTEIKSVAIVCSRQKEMGGTGYASLLYSIFNKNKLKAQLILPRVNELPIADLQNAIAYISNNYGKERFAEFSAIVKRNKINAAIFICDEPDLLLFDIITCRILKIFTVVIMPRTIGSYVNNNLNNNLSIYSLQTLPYIAISGNSVITNSKGDAIFLNMFGAQTHVIQCLSSMPNELNCTSQKDFNSLFNAQFWITVLRELIEHKMSNALPNYGTINSFWDSLNYDIRQEKRDNMGLMRKCCYYLLSKLCYRKTQRHFFKAILSEKR